MSTESTYRELKIMGEAIELPDDPADLHRLALEDRHLSNQANDLFYRGWLRNLEYGVDGIATAWAPSFPLIEWPKGKGE